MVQQEVPSKLLDTNKKQESTYCQTGKKMRERNHRPRDRSVATRKNMKEHIVLNKITREKEKLITIRNDNMVQQEGLFQTTDI